MTRSATRLSLGPIPKPETLKLSITITTELKNLLDAYAAVHARLHDESVDAAALIPHMLAAFIARDRGFKSAQRKAQGTPRP